MEWWHPLIVLFDIYLLLALGPWMAMQWVAWLATRALRQFQAEREYLVGVRKVLRQQETLWPSISRPGPYYEADDAARQALDELCYSVERVSEILADVQGASLNDLRLLDILALRSWPRLRRGIAALRALQEGWQLLDRTDAALDVLEEQERIVQQIPARARAVLSEGIAELRRIRALWETEAEWGTVGLDEIGIRLADLLASGERSLANLEKVEPLDLPHAVQEATRVAEEISSEAQVIEQTLTGYAQARSDAENLIERVRSGVQLAEERWRALQARGATEPSIGRRLAALRVEATSLVKVAEERTLESYAQAQEQGGDLVQELEVINAELAHLDELMQRSRAAVEGDVSIVAQVQAACEELMRQWNIAEPDESLVIIERAATTYLEAERQHGLGIIEGYERALALSKEASEEILRAEALTTTFAEQIPQVLDLLQATQPQVLEDWQQRAVACQEALSPYVVHWRNGLNAVHAEATGFLEQVLADLDRVPEAIREKRLFKQTQLGEALETLEHAFSSLESAAEAIEHLEQEQGRITALRQQFEAAAKELAEITWPDLEALSHVMLPELADKLKTLFQEYRQGLRARSGPADTNYDEATQDWLPSIIARIEEIAGLHEADVTHYRRVARDRRRHLDRLWSRLERLAPLEPPRPEEDAERLAADLEDWHTEVNKEKDNPLALSLLVGRRAHVLEQRLTTARQQIIEGRRALKGLRRQYARHVQAVQSLRSAIRDLERHSQWSQITWDLDEADALWEHTGTVERAALAAATLSEAVNQMQRAVNSAERAAQTYARLEHEIDTALARLDDELAEINTALLRGQRRAEQLQKEGHDPEADHLLARCEAATRIVEMAQQASSFEDALRHLREASNRLARI
mgnify:CR=1 FL=1